MEPFISGHPIVESTVTTFSVKLDLRSSARSVLYGVVKFPSPFSVSTSNS